MSYRIAGIDVHKKMLAVVVADVEVADEYVFERRQFGSNPEQLQLLCRWLIEQPVEEVVMESWAMQYGRSARLLCVEGKAPSLQIYLATLGHGLASVLLSCHDNGWEGFPLDKNPYVAQGGIEVSTLTQAESARPFTITTADNSGRIAINGVVTSLDEFRGTPYIQADIRVSRPIVVGERWSLAPFAEMFNVFNRNNPGANYVTNIATLPVPFAQAETGNIQDVCGNANCTTLQPIRSPNQLRVPGGALGDFFGPGTTVGIPFAAQLGIRIKF